MHEFTVPAADSVHVLFVGDSRDLYAMRNMLAELPASAYGQVFIEIASPIQIETLRTPAGVQVTWLARDRALEHSVADELPARGEVVSRAVRAWVAEWMPHAASGHDHFVMWVGCSSSPRVSDLYRELSRMLESPRPVSGDSTH